MAIFAAVWLLSVGSAAATHLPSPYDPLPSPMVSDTIPVKDNSGDFINDPNNNPFDITPSNVTKEVEYDPKSGKYILTEKIGDEYYRSPTYMTFEEYVKWREKEDQKNYFAKLGGISVGKDRKGSLEDPMASIDVSNTLVDRLFGGTEVNIQPQGQVDVTLQSRATRNEPAINRQGGSPWLINPIDPNVAIRVSVDGNIGSKMNLGFNYDTQSTFDFDRKIKLEYDTEAFGEDDIIKTIEAGNVSLPLRSNLIQGAQSLFGIKTELQFGHLRLTAIASQQQSEQKSITIENGNSVQEFEITPDEYDENRHFFLSHFHRDNYAKALENLPQINSAFRIADIEVWVSNTAQRANTTNFQNVTSVAALMDLGESNINDYNSDNPSFLSVYGPSSNVPQELIANIVDLQGNVTVDTLPDNRNNRLGELIENTEIKDEDQVGNFLASQGMTQNDFATFQARKLPTSDYTVNEQLGFISLNYRLRPDQSLAVAYTYYYSSACIDGGDPSDAQPTYQVGQLSLNNTDYATIGQVITDSTQLVQDTSEIEPNKVLFTKLLKGPTQPINKPSYDLMMKNVYSLRTSQLDPQEFLFDIFYEDDSEGTFKKFLPEEDLKFTPLLNLFNLDRLNRFNDPQSDGIFDYVPGVTVIPSTGTVVFPVLEPFGDDMVSLVREELINEKGLDPAQAEVLAQTVSSRYAYQALYDSSLTQAKQGLEFNKFRMKGFVKSSTSGDINLGPFVPPGSVQVRAGGVTLVEGADYEIDYSLGRLRIINDSYLSQGTPINVTFEDQTIFSLQQKNMMGLRADYNLSKKASVGATILRLSERPFTQKVNIGNDPISNSIYGLDYAYSSEAPGITKLVDKLPFYSTNAPSSINFYAEAAYLRPGYSSAINAPGEQEPVVSLDDFEGAINGVLLGGFNSQAWRLASTPSDPEFPEATLTGNLEYGANRARLSWYSIDQGARRSDLDNSSPYTRFVLQTELFDREVQIGQAELITFDLNYFPSERGPYNFDVPGGTNNSAGVDVAATNSTGQVILNEPETRWAGIMRAFQNTDFEQANYEFIEFWVLNPYMDRPDGSPHDQTEEGKIVFHLGSVSEDILRDGAQMYENGLPRDSLAISNVRTTPWGRTSVTIPFVTGFEQNRTEIQDLGYDGLSDELERVHYEDYINTMNGVVQVPSLVLDPSADNFRDVGETDPDMGDELPLVLAGKFLSNPQGNAPSETNNAGGNFRGNRFPDSEDMNNNRSFDGAASEGYYSYEIPITPVSGDNGLEIDINSDGARKYITDVVELTPDSGGPDEKWYRVRVPINNPDGTKDISGLRAIQFMRMYLTGFKSPKTFRLAEFQLLRNIWRKSVPSCNDDRRLSLELLTVDEVGVQENGGRVPLNYSKHTSILQERLQSTFANLLQDERSLSMKFEDVPDGCQVGINKLAELDLTLYDKLQLFVHAELDEFEDDIEAGDLKVFVKLAKDLSDHYYEYEIPVTLSEIKSYSVDSLNEQGQSNIWPNENILTIPLEYFLEAKQERIRRDIPVLDAFKIEHSVYDDTIPAGRIITVKGTPSLSRIKTIEIGVRNTNGRGAEATGEVWVNELRLLGLNQKGSVAGEARLQVQMADLGDINVSGSYSSVGWGALDQRLDERNRREIIEYDVATSLQLGKFFPDDWGISVPFYAQYSRNVSNLQFEPYEGDLTVDQKVSALEAAKPLMSQARQDSVDLEIEDIGDRSRETTTIKTYNFTNVKKTSKGSPKPWSPSNVSVSYSYTETTSTDPIIKEDKTVDHNTQLDYNYSRKASYLQPFKKLKPKYLKIIKEINFNPLPNSFTFGTNINRTTNSRLYRLPSTPEFQFDDKRYLWNRDYGLNWDLTKSIKFNFKARAESIVDELRQQGIAETAADRNWFDENGNRLDFGGVNNPDLNDTVKDSVDNYRANNFRTLGRSKNYNHNIAASYNLPIRHLPYMDWVSAKADYKASYNWTAGALIEIDDKGTLLGNTISNNATTSLSATLSFDKLYSKSKYLKAIDKGKPKTRRSSRSKKKTTDKVDEAKQKAKKTKKKDTGPSKVERLLIRPLLLLRNVKATYREDRGTTLPGFMSEETDAHGLLQGVNRPGLGFIAGLQPDVRANAANSNFLFDNQQWFNPSANFNGILTQTRRQTADVKIALEPIKDLDIDIDFKKSYSDTYTDQFKYQKDESAGPIQAFGVEMGSYNFTHIGGISTLFSDNVGLYNDFVAERQTVSYQLAVQESGETNPTTIPVYVNGKEGYYSGFGPENPDVAVPAFLKAYTGRTYDVTQEDQLLNQVQQRTYIPAPNWNIKYDGLGKLEMFKDVISSFSLRHAYIGTTTIGSFSSNILFNSTEPVVTSNGSYQARFNIPGLRVVDQFAPLIGFSLKLKNEMTFEGGFNKARALNLTQLNLQESLNSEITFGFGYTIKNFRSGKTKKGKRRKKEQEDEKAKKDDKLTGRGRGSRVNRSRGKTLTMNLDFSISDNTENAYALSQNQPPEIVRGSRNVIINPSVDYDVNKNLTMRFFVNYNNSITRNTLSVNRLDIRAGATAQLKIN